MSTCAALCPAGADGCQAAVLSATAALVAMTQCTRSHPEAAAPTAAPFPLAIAAAGGRPGALSEPRAQKQGHLLSVLRSALASTLVADSAALTAFSRPLTMGARVGVGSIQQVR